MEVRVDAERCIGAGNCALLSPDVFDQRDEDGIVTVLTERIDASQESDVRRAASACPASVIELVPDTPRAGETGA